MPRRSSVNETEIASLFRSGRSARSLAQEHGLTPSSIYRAVERWELKAASGSLQQLSGDFEASNKDALFNGWYAATGIIYIVNMRGTDYYKIGYTGSNPLLRLAALQVGCPEPIDLVITFPGTMADERSCQDLYEQYKTAAQNEWYRIPSEIMIGFTCQLRSRYEFPKDIVVSTGRLIEQNISDLTSGV